MRTEAEGNLISFLAAEILEAGASLPSTPDEVFAERAGRKINPGTLALPGVRVIVEAYQRGPIESLEDGDAEKVWRRALNVNSVSAPALGFPVFTLVEGGFVLTDAARTWVDGLAARAEFDYDYNLAAAETSQREQEARDMLSNLSPSAMARLAEFLAR